jgi:flagellar L-ring protein precursor FlgH
MLKLGNQNLTTNTAWTSTAKYFVLLACAFLFTACAFTPSSIIKQPKTAATALPQPATASSGAIYSASSHRALFEDRRARFIGDILTINIVENTSAKKATSSAGSKAGSISSNVEIPLGLPIALNKEGISISADSAVDYDDSADEEASNNFSGNITVTVTEVLGNGNLSVSGEKQVALDKGTEFVRFSGVVNPDDITLGNLVSSTKIADARMEYRTNSTMDASQVVSILARFFLSFSPI